MSMKALHARIEQMTLLKCNYDECGSVPASAKRAAAARNLLIHLNAEKLLHAVKGLTLCPSGNPLFDFRLGDRTASIVCEHPWDWHIVVAGIGVIAANDRTDTVETVRLLGAYLRGEIVAGDC